MGIKRKLAIALAVVMLSQSAFTNMVFGAEAAEPVNIEIPEDKEAVEEENTENEPEVQIPEMEVGETVQEGNFEFEKISDEPIDLESPEAQILQQAAPNAIGPQAMYSIYPARETIEEGYSKTFTTNISTSKIDHGIDYKRDGAPNGSLGYHEEFSSGGNIAFRVTGISPGSYKYKVFVHDPYNSSIVLGDTDWVYVTVPHSTYDKVVTPSSYTLQLGGQIQMSSNIFRNIKVGSGYHYRDYNLTGVTWTSSNTSVADFDKNYDATPGLLKAKSPGTTIVTVKSLCDSYSASATITVAGIPPNSMSLDKYNATLDVNDTLTLNQTTYPTNATDNDVTWTSSNNSVVMVTSSTNARATLKAVSEGQATITATNTKHPSIKASCTVTVNTPYVEVEEVNITTIPNEMEINDTLALAYEIKPSNATNKTLEWISSNSDIASVSSTGVVTAKAKGTAEITAQSADDPSAKVTIKVQQ